MRLQQHVTHFLLSAIFMLGSNGKEEASSHLALTLVNGVSARLSSSLEEIRKDGMRVAELLAKRMDSPLRFEEIDHEREIDGIVITEISTEEPPEKKKEVIRKKGRGVNKKRVSRRPVDPDAEYMTDQDSDSSQTDDDADNDSDLQGDEDSVWDDNEPLIPYNLDDDEEDLRETPTPLYLRQCLDMLRTPDTEDAAWSRHESALGAMSPLIRSNPADLPDLTTSLCGAILHLENKFDLPNFDVDTEAGLVSLAVMQPLLAGEYLIKNFFSSQVGLGTRLSVLHTLESAAYELCGAKALEKECRKLISER
jgi:telomere length regulation protein